MKIGSDMRREKEKRNKQNNAERYSKYRQRGYMCAAWDDPERTDD